jgi:ElaB/YqjD/DUF883 family membrane-anchored ribosome-binding protein
MPIGSGIVYRLTAQHFNTRKTDMNQFESTNPTPSVPTSGSSTSYGSSNPPGGNGGVARTLSDASATAHSTIDKMSNAARPAVDRLATGAHQAVDKLAGAATTAADTLAVKTEQLKGAHARMTEECRVYVRSNPLAAVGVAVLTGFILSRLFRPR